MAAGRRDHFALSSAHVTTIDRPDAREPRAHGNRGGRVRTGSAPATTAAAVPAAPAAAGSSATLNVGDQAPDFKLPGSDGKTHSLSDYKGKTLVLAWFPKAFTGG